MDNQPMRGDQLPATKGDLDSMRTDLEAELARYATKEDLQAFRREVALGFDRSYVRMDAKFDALFDLMRQTRSDLMAACEKALTMSSKVDRDQLFTRDRLDRLEGRVTTLETRRKRRPS
jgi:hypothetical protein